MPRKKLIRSFSISEENVAFIEEVPAKLRSKFVDDMITRTRQTIDSAVAKFLKSAREE